MGALTSANQQLGNVQGLLSTTQSSLNDVSNTMQSMRDVLVKLSDQNVSGNERTQYAAQYISSYAVIAHPARASISPGCLVDSTNRTVSSTEARLAFAVLTTERKAA